MMRSLYRGLLWLHPLEFREEFAGEMLWIFDEAAETVGVIPLLADALGSLLRQWTVRTRAWKFAIGAMVNATFWTALLLGPELFPGASPKPLRPWAGSARPQIHFKLYLVVEKPVWDDRKQTALPRR
jgi:hypothetical protein